MPASHGNHREIDGPQPIIPDHVTLVWLEEWDARNAVAKGTDRLREILLSVHKYAKRPLGCGLKDRRVVVRI